MTSSSATRWTTAVLLGLAVLTAGCDVQVDLDGEERSGGSAGADSPPPQAVEAPSPAAAPPTWGDTYEAVSSGVVRIEGLACQGVATGSGFLVDDDLVATAAHVVEGISSLAVRAGDQVRAVEVLGLDSEADVALLRLDADVEGHVFSWADADPRVGDDIAAVGYPLGQPQAMTRGAVTAVERRIEVEGRDRHALVQTDAAINPGNSGGPLLTLSGEAAGVVSAGSEAPGDAYAVSSQVASAAVARWQDTAPVDTAEAACDPDEAGPAYEGVPIDVEVQTDHPEAPVLAHLLRERAEAINTGEYWEAYEMVTPAVRGDLTLEEFSEQLASSYWTQIDVLGVDVVSETVDEVEVGFRTLQDSEYGPEGQTCSDWHVTYRMVLDSGNWQVDRSSNVEDPSACDEELEQPEGNL